MEFIKHQCRSGVNCKN